MKIASSVTLVDFKRHLTEALLCAYVAQAKTGVASNFLVENVWKVLQHDTRYSHYKTELDFFTKVWQSSLTMIPIDCMMHYFEQTAFHLNSVEYMYFLFAAGRLAKVKGSPKRTKHQKAFFTFASHPSFSEFRSDARVRPLVGYFSDIITPYYNNLALNSYGVSVLKFGTLDTLKWPENFSGNKSNINRSNYVRNTSGTHYFIYYFGQIFDMQNAELISGIQIGIREKPSVQEFSAARMQDYNKKSDIVVIPVDTNICDEYVALNQVVKGTINSADTYSISYDSDLTSCVISPVSGKVIASYKDIDTTYSLTIQDASLQQHTLKGLMPSDSLLERIINRNYSVLATYKRHLGKIPIPFQACSWRGKTYECDTIYDFAAEVFADNPYEYNIDFDALIISLYEASLAIIRDTYEFGYITDFINNVNARTGITYAESLTLLIETEIDCSDSWFEYLKTHYDVKASKNPGDIIFSNLPFSGKGFTVLSTVLGVNGRVPSIDGTIPLLHDSQLYTAHTYKSNCDIIHAAVTRHCDTVSQYNIIDGDSLYGMGNITRSQVSTGIDTLYYDPFIDKSDIYVLCALCAIRDQTKNPIPCSTTVADFINDIYGYFSLVKDSYFTYVLQLHCYYAGANRPTSINSFFHPAVKGMPTATTNFYGIVCCFGATSPGTSTRMYRLLETPLPEKRIDAWADLVSVSPHPSSGNYTSPQIYSRALETVNNSANLMFTILKDFSSYGYGAYSPSGRPYTNHSAINQNSPRTCYVYRGSHAKVVHPLYDGVLTYNTAPVSFESYTHIPSIVFARLTYGRSKALTLDLEMATVLGETRSLSHQTVKVMEILQYYVSNAYKTIYKNWDNIPSTMYGYMESKKKNNPVRSFSDFFNKSSLYSVLGISDYMQSNTPMVRCDGRMYTLPLSSCQYFQIEPDVEYYDTFSSHYTYSTYDQYVDRFTNLIQYISLFKTNTWHWKQQQNSKNSPYVLSLLPREISHDYISKGLSEDQASPYDAVLYEDGTVRVPIDTPLPDVAIALKSYVGSHVLE